MIAIKRRSDIGQLTSKLPWVTCRNSIDMIASSSDLSGLTEEQVIFSREQFGTNNTSKAGGNKLLDTIQSLLQEPMLFLLLIASFIHLLSWQLADAVFLMIAILLVSAISLYQTARSDRALEKLKALTEPQCQVIRNNNVIAIPAADLVVSDYLVVEK